MDFALARPHGPVMQFATTLRPATLIKRYKRFLADCRLEDGREITAHCANPGSMMGMAEPGIKVWLEPNDDPRKKLDYGWRLIEHENGHFTGVDTALPNRMLKAALEAREMQELAAYSTVRPEVKYGEKSRIDFLLTGEGLPDCYVEVKSVTLCRQPSIAEFPDSVTARGARHMDELAAMAQAGHRAVVLFLVQRTDAREMRIAADIDPAYAKALLAAMAAGVEVIAYGTHISPECITLGPALPFTPPEDA